MRDGNHPRPRASASGRLSVVLIIGLASVAANVLISVMLFRDRGATPRGTNAALDSHRNNSLSGSSTPEAEIAGAEPTKDPLADFWWSQIENADRQQYIRNLRAFGVPERTIRDLIIADVQRLYQPKLAALRRGNRTIRTNFWEKGLFSFNPNQNLTAEQRAELRAVQNEEKDLVQSLLGKDVYAQIARDSGYPDWTERMFGGSIPQDKRDLAMEIQQRFSEAKQDAYAKADGYVDQDIMEEVKALEKKMHAELATVLTPEQLFEYELRNSDLSNNLKFQMAAFDPGEEEYRAIFKYKQAMDPVDGGTPESRKEAESMFQDSLGPDRLKEYYLLQDGDYQNLANAGVSREAILQVAETKTQTQQAATAIREDKSLTPAQRTEALQTLRANTENTLADLLGQRRARYYENSGGWWLRNIAPTDPARE